jgi:hypothetical protein
VPAREEDSSLQRPLEREQTNKVCERRVERAPLLSGRSSRRGGYQPGSEILLGLACLRGRKTAAFSARSSASKQTRFASVG